MGFFRELASIMKIITNGYYSSTHIYFFPGESSHSLHRPLSDEFNPWTRWWHRGAFLDARRVALDMKSRCAARG
jgi:hypothetical protein